MTTRASRDVGVANAQQIVADAAILAVIGHFNSGVAILHRKSMMQNNLVMVSPANTNPRDGSWSEDGQPCLRS